MMTNTTADAKNLLTNENSKKMNCTLLKSFDAPSGANSPSDQGEKQHELPQPK
jgi:hypothetical protein